MILICIFFSPSLSSTEWFKENDRTDKKRSASRGEVKESGGRGRFTRWQVAIVVRDGVVGFLPWPANRRWSWERSAVCRPRLRRLAWRHDPSRDRADTGRDSRGRTFYYVKRQLETQNRARPRERRLQRIRRGDRVVHYASLRFALLGSPRLGRARPRSAVLGALRRTSARLGGRVRVSIGSGQSQPTSHTTVPERREGSFLRMYPQIDDAGTLRFSSKFPRNCSPFNSLDRTSDPVSRREISRERGAKKIGI